MLLTSVVDATTMLQSGSGRAALIQAPQADGTPLPFGATVQDETGKEIGVVAQASKIFARGLDDSGALTVRWGADSRSFCRIAYELPVVDRRGRAPAIQSVKSVCRADSASAAH